MSQGTQMCFPNRNFLRRGLFCVFLLRCCVRFRHKWPSEFLHYISGRGWRGSCLFSLEITAVPRETKMSQNYFSSVVGNYRWLALDALGNANVMQRVMFIDGVHVDIFLTLHISLLRHLRLFAWPLVCTTTRTHNIRDSCSGWQSVGAVHLRNYWLQGAKIGILMWRQCIFFIRSIILFLFLEMIGLITGLSFVGLKIS